jgi:uncharacterized protein
MSMELDNSFTVPVPPDQAWDVLLDVERIAPCMPGATVDEVDGDVVNGRIKVKVGPVSLTYRGTAKFIERDPDARTMVMEASGKETRGAGTASATVRASLVPDSSGDATQVSMHTTMNVTGRPAQFGRGVMVEVGGKLVEQFAKNLAQLITGDTAAGPAGDVGASGGAGTAVSEAGTGRLPGGPGTSTGNGAGGSQGVSAGVSEAGPRETGTGTAGPVTATAAPPAAESQEDSLDLIRLVGPAVLKRVVPVVLAAVALILLSLGLRRVRSRQGQGEPAE